VAEGPVAIGVFRFTQVARRLAAAAGAAGLVAPAFRTPPRLAGANRTIRRLPGGPVVSVRVAGRSSDAVAADLIEGIVVANALDGEAAVRLRTALWAAVTSDHDRSAA
jgi:hypothetical protein